MTTVLIEFRYLNFIYIFLVKRIDVCFSPHINNMTPIIILNAEFSVYTTKKILESCSSSYRLESLLWLMLLSFSCGEWFFCIIAKLLYNLAILYDSIELFRVLLTLSAQAPESYSSHLVCRSCQSVDRSVNIGSQRSLGFKP